MTLEKEHQRRKLTKAIPFPGSLPVSMSENDIPQLYDGSYAYVFAPKTNGLRFFLVMCTVHDQPMMVLTDRSNRVYSFLFDEASVTIPSILFDGTVLDGELVSLFDGSFAFLTFDCIQANGVPCGEYAYPLRLQIAQLAIQTLNQNQNPNVWKQQYGLEFRVKAVFHLNQFVSMLYQHLPRLDHDIDGLILTACDAPVVSGRAVVQKNRDEKQTYNLIYKFKRGCDNTIDFFAQQDTRGNSLRVGLFSYDTNHKNLVWWSVEDPFRFESLDSFRKRLGLSSSIQTELDAIKVLHGAILECRFDPENQRWIVENLRGDKHLPNSLEVAEKTFENIRENLTLCDLIPQGALKEYERDKIRSWESAHPRWILESERKTKTQPRCPQSNIAMDGKTGISPPNTMSWDEACLAVPEPEIKAVAPIPFEKLIQF